MSIINLADYKSKQREEQYKIVVIENAYDFYEVDEHVRKMLADLFALKIKSYKKYYPYGILPVSAVDFFCTHLILMKKCDNSDEYEIVSGFKSITNRRCEVFRSCFPVVDHMFGQSPQYKDHTIAINKWIDENSKKVIAYNASWTMKDDIAERFVRDEITTICASMMYYHYTGGNIDFIIASASAPYKVYLTKEKMGWKYFENSQGKLPAFKAYPFFDEEFFMMYINTKDFSDSFKQSVSELKKLWDKREVINLESVKVKKAA